MPGKPLGPGANSRPRLEVKGKFWTSSAHFLQLLKTLKHSLEQRKGYVDDCERMTPFLWSPSAGDPAGDAVARRCRVSLLSAMPKGCRDSEGPQHTGAPRQRRVSGRFESASRRWSNVGVSTSNPNRGRDVSHGRTVRASNG